jgi:hypothetical protein
MANGQSGASILVGTANFDAAWTAGTPDFIMPANVMAPSGRVAFGTAGSGNCFGAAPRYDSVAYGSGYAGTVDYAPAFGTDLPISGNSAVQIKAGSFDATQGPGGNAADYEIASNPAPCKNAPSGSPICGTVNASSDTDGDGVPNTTDLCPGTAAMATVDANGCSDAQVDQDGDGICNPGAPSAGPAGCTGSDNCQAVSNPGQSNADSDAFGDACDTEGPSPNTNGTGGADDCTDTVDNDGDTMIDLADPACSTTDTDGDGVPNVSDNCPSTPNPGQQNFDATQTWGGDSQGDACDSDDDDDGYLDDVEAATPVCAGSVNDDNADDALVNDGCPAVGASESNCANSADDDTDGRTNDGCPQVATYSEGAFNVGTGIVNPCSVGVEAAPSPSWPSDLVSGSIPNSTDKITIGDLTSFLAGPAGRRMDSSPGNAAFSPRWDLTPGRGLFGQWININDLTALLAGTSGFPGMFGGLRAFNGPACTGP